ncbi:MAG: hypothetical protein ABIZ34_03505, partial [Candidatus Limnocylindrales bacterium]
AIVDPASSDASSAPNVPGGGAPVAAFEAVVLIALAVIGAVVASRQPRNAIGWIFCVIPLSMGLLVLSAHAYWALTSGDPQPSRPAEVVAWLASWIWIPAMVSTLTLFPLLFPDGRPPSPRWRPVVWLIVIAAVTLFIGTAFAPGQFEDYPVVNPFGAGRAAAIVGWVGFGLLLGAALAAIVSLIVRFRHSHGDERQQLKWVTSAAVVFVVLFVVPTENFAGDDIGFATLLFGMLIIAAGVAVAMLRYRLYDIDVVINRALVYGALTAMLAGTYLGSVLLLQLALRTFTEGSGLAVAASTLATAALFRPLRARTQAVVDRRFFRRKYDAAQTLERFGARLRDEVDLDTLTTELRAVVAETMQPAHVNLWVRTPGDAR